MYYYLVNKNELNKLNTEEDKKAFEEIRNILKYFKKISTELLIATSDPTNCSEGKEERCVIPITAMRNPNVHRVISFFNHYYSFKLYLNYDLGVKYRKGLTKYQA